MRNFAIFAMLLTLGVFSAACIMPGGDDANWARASSGWHGIDVSFYAVGDGVNWHFPYTSYKNGTAGKGGNVVATISVVPYSVGIGGPGTCTPWIHTSLQSTPCGNAWMVGSDALRDGCASPTIGDPALLAMGFNTAVAFTGGGSDCNGGNIFNDTTLNGGLRIGNMSVPTGLFSTVITETPDLTGVYAGVGSVNLNTAGGHLPLDARVSILASINPETDVTVEDVGGVVQEVVHLNLTGFTVNGETFRPDGAEILVYNYSRLAFDQSQPGLRPLAAWVADQMEMNLGLTPEWSIEVNGNLTITGEDVNSWLPDNMVLEDEFVNERLINSLRDFAGSTPVDVDPTDRRSLR